MAALSAGEKQLLTFPPTPETWDCGRKYKVAEIVDGAPAEVEYTCGGRMSGRYSTCTFCRQPKRKAAVRPYARYQAACAKAKIEPGTRWPLVAEADPAEAIKPKRKTKRKGA